MVIIRFYILRIQEHKGLPVSFLFFELGFIAKNYTINFYEIKRYQLYFNDLYILVLYIFICKCKYVFVFIIYSYVYITIVNMWHIYNISIIHIWIMMTTILIIMTCDIIICMNNRRLQNTLHTLTMRLVKTQIQIAIAVCLSVRLYLFLL